MNQPHAQVAAPTAKSALSPLRIILFVVLSVMLLLLVSDRLARYRAQSAHAQLESHVTSEEEDTGGNLQFVSPENVRKIVGREPSDSTVRNKQTIETYTWPSLIREYTVHVVYTRGQLPAVDRTYLNERPAELDLPEQPSVAATPSPAGTPAVPPVPAAPRVQAPTPEPEIKPGEYLIDDEEEASAEDTAIEQPAGADATAEAAANEGVDKQDVQ